MTDRETVVWAPDPFNPASENPRPWLVVSGRDLPYPEQESIAVALTTQSHHTESVRIPSDAWVQGEPRDRSYALPWSVATLKDDIHIAGVQDAVTEAFANRIADATASYLTA